MQDLQRKIITDTLTGRIKEIEEEIVEFEKFELDTKEDEVELYFYKEFLNNLDNFREKSQYWNVAELYFEGEDDDGPYENPISAIDSLVVISRICSLAKYVVSAFKDENIYSLYIEGMTLDFQKIREAM